MSATYKTTLATARDRIRFALGDTDVTSALLSDQEIAAALSAKGSEDAATTYLARGLVAKFANQPNHVTADGVTLDYSERIAIWREVAQAAQAVTTGGGFRIRRVARPQLIGGGTEL